MDLIYRHTNREWEPGKPILQQMEVHGQPTELYIFRFAAVYATSRGAALAIQRQYRQSKGN